MRTNRISGPCSNCDRKQHKKGSCPNLNGKDVSQELLCTSLCTLLLALLETIFKTILNYIQNYLNQLLAYSWLNLNLTANYKG